MANGMAATIEPGSVLSPQHWASLRAWYHNHGRHHLPWRVGATPWDILLAEVLLHRTRASTVERLYKEVSKQFPSPESIVGQPSEWLKAARPAGLAWRADCFISTCESLIALHRSNVPSGWTDLTSLPGIGHYIASTVRCFGFGFPEAIVDTNTVRLASRITGEPLSSSHHRSRGVKQAVASILANGTAGSAKDNYALLDLASLVCHTRKPLCDQCPVVSACVTGSQILADFAPTGEC